MKTFSVTIEETIAETFEIEANSYDDAMETAIIKYNKKEIGLLPGELQHKQISVYNPDKNKQDWFEF